MKYVYMLNSLVECERYYVGSTFDLKRRLLEHNSGESIHTKKYKPWKIVCYLGFEDEAKANAFEVYLKTASGRSFAKKHF